MGFLHHGYHLRGSERRQFKLDFSQCLANVNVDDFDENGRGVGSKRQRGFITVSHVSFAGLDKLDN